MATWILLLCKRITWYPLWILNYKYNKIISNFFLFSLSERKNVFWVCMHQLKEDDIILWQHKISISFWKTYIIPFNYVYVCVCVHMSADSYRGQKKAFDPWKLPNQLRWTWLPLEQVFIYMVFVACDLFLVMLTWSKLWWIVWISQNCSYQVLIEM